MMNMRDDIELTVLAETGDVFTAEACGFAIEYTWEAMCAVLGIPFDVIKGGIS